MTADHTFSKELLKKMFLKVLYENREKEIFSSVQHEADFLSIICEILADQFNINTLTEKEFNEIILAVNELEYSGYIKHDISNPSKKAKELTDKGKNYVLTSLLYFSLPDQETETLLTRADLKEECLDDYLNGDYEVSVLKAFRLVEDITRKKSFLTSSLKETKNISMSFVTTEGKLVTANNTIDTDIKALERIMLGALSWFNTSPDRNDASSAARILVFANQHLNLIDQKKVII